MLEAGLAFTGCTLAARAYGLEQVYVTNERLGDPNICRIWFVPLDTESYPYSFVFTTKFTQPSFPYGIPCEPDEPA